MALLGALLLVAAGGGVGLLAAVGVFDAGAAQPTVVAAASPAATRQIVSSTLSGNTPTPTLTPVSIAPPSPVAATQLQPSGPPAFSAGPPALVQQITPVSANSPVASSSGTAARQPAQPVASATPRPAATQSIADELKSINATATALTQRAASLSASPSPGAAGTPRPAPTDTPIATAAPPTPPQA